MKIYEPGQIVKINARDVPNVTEGTYVEYDATHESHKIWVDEKTYHRIFGIPEVDPLHFFDDEVEPIEHTPTAGGTEVQHRVEVINPEGAKIADFTMDTLREAEEFRNSAERNDGYQYRILRIETTEVKA